MDIDDLIVNAIEKDPLKIQDAVNHLMVQKAGELVAQRREEMAQTVFGGLPQDEYQQEDDTPEDATDNQDAVEVDDQDTFSDDDIEEFLDQNLDDILQDLDNIEAEDDQETT